MGLNLKSYRSGKYWKAWRKLTPEVQAQAEATYKLWKKLPWHSSLEFKQVHPTKPIYSIRIGKHWRALGDMGKTDIVWFWIGTHGEYDKLTSQPKKLEKKA